MLVNNLRKAAQQNFFSTTEALLHAIDAKDSYTAGHSKRVSELSAFVAKELGKMSRKLKSYDIVPIFMISEKLESAILC